jgi:DNA polymerase III subunit gamma/tau
MGVALYRKYRSRTLDEVVGQQHVTTLLRNALQSDQTAHAYLFTGPRGVGKTSIARILAHEINNIAYDDESTHLDIIEIDAASNNGVEDIRDLRDRVQIAPVSAKKKVYIIDEVHMLSKQAFNALLKTLEEPPKHVVFILATTDLDKVPETIVSRTQRHTFRRASEADIMTNLERIATKEGVSLDEQAARLIARHADGSFRDSVSLLDQLISGADSKKISASHVITSLGLVAEESIEQLIELVRGGDISAIDTTLRRLESEGVPARTTASQLTDFLRSHLADDAQYPKLIDNLLDVSRSQYPDLKLLTVLCLHAAPSGKGGNVANEPTPPPKPSRPQQPATLKATPSIAKTQAVQPTPEEPSESLKVKPVQKRPRATQPGEFDWKALIEHVRTHHVALHSVLCKCEPERDGDILRLYTKSAFYKKKLDDTKYRTLLLDSIKAIGYELDVETVAEAMPMKDSQAAQVAAIMGGGEEVSVEDA